jgi:hypothetical protein
MYVVEKKVVQHQQQIRNRQERGRARVKLHTAPASRASLVRLDTRLDFYHASPHSRSLAAS